MRLARLLGVNRPLLLSSSTLPSSSFSFLRLALPPFEEVRVRPWPPFLSVGESCGARPSISSRRSWEELINGRP